MAADKLFYLVILEQEIHEYGTHYMWLLWLASASAFESASVDAPPPELGQLLQEEP